MINDPKLKLPNTTLLYILFDRPSITTETEEEAYSIGYLVADCGGVMGLFVGFNFLMIWDLVHLWLASLKSRILR